MGSIDATYRKMLREFIRISTINSPLRREYTKSYLADKNEDELEKIATIFKEQNPLLACFNAGIAVAHFMNDPNTTNDELNAGIGGMGQLQLFVGIDDEDE